MHAKLDFAVFYCTQFKCVIFAQFVATGVIQHLLTRKIFDIWYLKQAVVKSNDFIDYCLINQVFLLRLLLILWEEPNMKSTGGRCLS